MLEWFNADRQHSVRRSRPVLRIASDSSTLPIQGGLGLFKVRLSHPRVRLTGLTP